LTDKDINQYLDNYQEEVIDYANFRMSNKTFTNKWLELSKYLITPISIYLTNSKIIYFVPHGFLHYLPLHALLLNKEPLIKTHPVVYSSSNSLLQFYRNKGSGKLKSCAVFGVEFLDEAEKVAMIFRGKVFSDVSKEHVLKNLNNDILHFSCHGYFDNRDPLLSGIVLKDDVLRAEKIFKLKINSELVTLSACETGISENKPGDELLGLTRAFIYAGAASLVVSLWDVSAYTTKELMHEFYTNLKNGYQKAIALQKAQVKVMEMENCNHPFFWAPFILVGDWE
jgi:CHAT domain-containing protein